MAIKSVVNYILFINSTLIDLEETIAKFSGDM